MIQQKIREKKCDDCNKSLTFEDFWQINPSFTEKQAQEFWNDPMVLIYCPDCYFNRPEKPFKIKRGYYNYSSKFRI